MNWPAVDQGKRNKEIISEMPTNALVGYLMTAVSGLRTMIRGGAARDTLNPVINLIMKTLS